MNTTSLQRALLLVGLLSLAGAAGAQDKSDADGFSAGIKLSGQASAQDTGLPPYPGARPSPDNDQDSAAASFGVWAGSFGAKLVVVKLETSDSPDKVAAYYRDALAKYGEVLDCGTTTTTRAERKSRAKRDLLSCDSDQAEHHGRVYKAGTRRQQHIVGIEPRGKGARIQIVYLEAKGVD